MSGQSPRFSTIVSGKDLILLTIRNWTNNNTLIDALLGKLLRECAEFFGRVGMKSNVCRAKRAKTVDWQFAKAGGCRICLCLKHAFISLIAYFQL